MATAATLETMQYLSFRLAEETFAFDISQVREVLDYTPITRVPRMPDFMRGVINLRGAVVPVVDLRLKFGMDGTERAVNTCIIIAEVALAGETSVIGALADSVQEVVELEPGQIEPAPRLGSTVQSNFIRGMGKRDDLFLIILDIDRVFSLDEHNLLQETRGLAEHSDP